MSSTSIYQSQELPFVPTYLYIKQHSDTGKLYFGKTVRKDPVKYPGSGTHWKNHIKKHGKERVETLWYCLFEYQEECTKFALDFSEHQDIVKSDKWLNLKSEDGLDGIAPGFKFSEESKRKMSDHAKTKIGSKNSMFGKTHTPEVCRFLGDQLSIRNKSSNWYNNGIENIYSNIHPGNNFELGRIQASITKGFKWYNNGITNTSSKDHPGIGWNLGMLKRNSLTV